MSKHILWLLSWSREIALLLWAAALFYLPWFRDPSPPAGLSPEIYAQELITNGYESLILAYSLGLLAYLLSRFTKWKAAAIVPLVAAGWFFVSFIFFGFMGSATGVPGRGLGGSFETMGGFPALAGMSANGYGVIAMTVGLLAAAPGRSRTAVLFASTGAFLGFLVWLSYTGLAFLLMPVAQFAPILVWFTLLTLGGAAFGWVLGKWRGQDGRYTLYGTFAGSLLGLITLAGFVTGAFSIPYGLYGHFSNLFYILQGGMLALLGALFGAVWGRRQGQTGRFAKIGALAGLLFQLVGLRLLGNLVSLLGQSNDELDALFVYALFFSVLGAIAGLLLARPPAAPLSPPPPMNPSPIHKFTH